jgi:hypothetical protein
MRSNRRRNWFIRRIALGFAVAAFVAPVAQARIDEGQQVRSSSPALKAIAYREFSAQSGLRGDQIEVVRSVPRSTGSSVVAGDYGMPRALPVDYALSKGDQIEVVRAQPRGSSSDEIRALPVDYALSKGDQVEVVRTQPRGSSSAEIEFVRTQPRSTSPALVASRFGRPNATTSTELAAFDWNDAGIGAGLMLGLLLLGGAAAVTTRYMGRAQTA